VIWTSQGPNDHGQSRREKPATIKKKTSEDLEKYRTTKKSGAFPPMHNSWTIQKKEEVRRLGITEEEKAEIGRG